MNPRFRPLRVYASASLVLGLLVVAALSGEPDSSSLRTKASAANFEHRIWDELLQTHVDDAGLVAYRDLQENRVAFDEYLAALATANPEKWPEPDQIAFWLNAYNAGIVSAVLQGRTAEPAIGRIKLFKFWKFEVAGEKRSLDEIEHQILRKKFDEPRIHFGLVCASSSCPPLRREAFVPAMLETQLEDQGHRFANDPARNVIDPYSQSLRISEIFKWFEEDFVRDAGSVPEFLARYVAEEEAREWLLSTEVDIEYLDYDWSLNAQENQRPRRP